MNSLLRSLLPVAFSCFALTGCAGSDASNETSEETSTGSAALSAANSWQYKSTHFECNAAISGKVTATSRRQYFGIAGEAGQDATFSLDGTWPNAYGSVVIVTDASGNVLAQKSKTSTNSVKVSLTFASTATYYVWVSAYSYTSINSTYNFTLGSTCSEPSCDVDGDCDAGERCSKPVCITTPCNFPGTCVASAVCAEYTTSDGRYYAKNFAAGSYASAATWITLDPEVVSSRISNGTCRDLPTEACQGESAVCGAPQTADAFSTFASRCAFEAVVRQNAGTTGEYKGKYTAGACEDALFCATATLTSNVNSPTYYAQNFATQADAQAFLTTSFPGAASTTILADRCDAGGMCPMIYQPVCGTIKDGAAKTYTNSCAFLTAVRKDATGAVGAGSKGHYAQGACPTTPTCDYNNPHRNYVAQSPATCQVVKFFCPVNRSAFFDSCGCGCTDGTPLARIHQPSRSFAIDPVPVAQ